MLAGLAATVLWSPSATGAQEAPTAPGPPTVVDDGPTETGEVSGRPHPESAPEAAGRPVFQLPFRWDELWQAGSPHEANDSALDFGPRRIGGNDDVVAAAAGTVQRVTCSGGSYPRVDHGNGWVSLYYHVINVNWSLVGHRVLAGTRLGDAGEAVPCGGRSTFPHVHFFVEHHGRAVTAEGVSMGGYTVHSAGRDYYGHWTRDGDGATVVTNPGEARCCLRSTTRPFAVPDQGVLADANGDGQDDFVLRRGTTISISTDSAIPGGSPDAERRFTWGRNTDQLHLGDVTGDGRADFVFRRGAEYFVNHDLFQAGGDVNNDRHFTWGRRTDRLYLDDIDGDGRDDFVLRNGPSISISTDSAVAGGDSNTEHRFSYGQSTDRLHLGDVTGDGYADFVLKRGADYFIDHDVLAEGGEPGSDRQFTWGRSRGPPPPRRRRRRPARGLRPAQRHVDLDQHGLRRRRWRPQHRAPLRVGPEHRSAPPGRRDRRRTGGPRPQTGTQLLRQRRRRADRWRPCGRPIVRGRDANGHARRPAHDPP